ncbi:hypothetical protein FRC07_012669 [Ceratobasidium sp. 392]|nr:hypothetical protein FRC07_012669 [Ceratobasidium sp. 392]
MPPGKASANAGKKSSNNTSGNPAKNPEPPKDSPATPDIPAPKNSQEAIDLLVKLGLLADTGTIKPGTLVDVLHEVAAHPELHNFFKVTLTALALIAPKALDLTHLVLSGLSDMKERLDKLKSATQNRDKATEVLSAVDKAVASSEAAEKAAQESHNALTTFVDAQGQRQDNSHAAANPKEKIRKSNPQSSLPGPHILSADAIEEIQRKNATFLVIPDPIAQKNDKKMLPKDLLQKASEAYDAAWKYLASTTFPAEQGLTAKPRVLFKSVERLPKGGYLYGLETYNQTTFLCEAQVAKAFEVGFGRATVMGQRANIFLKSAPTQDWDPENKDDVRALE